ncbi:MAG: UvrD-helicase domain-containing protein [Bacillota bacterium]|nr:UvrD-helicase domain-containing protein [Bacillota bacterium]MDW7676266.1 UvrD-helicase domain-containing protein [Bacillota bacterium]
MIQQMITQRGINLNAQQHRAMEHYRGPAIVLAVAGAGKTTVMCARMAHLMTHHQVPPEKIRNLTFSRAAATDMQKRFMFLFGELEDSHQVVFSTIHSLAHGVVRSFYRQQGISFQLIENRKHKLYKPRLLRALYQQVNRAYPSEDEMEEMLQKVSLAKNRMMTTEAIGGLVTSVKGFQSVYQRYESYKKANGWLDYDDLLTEAYRILVTHEEWKERYHQRFQFWQVDEFQDTSLLQWQTSCWK